MNKKKVAAIGGLAALGLILASRRASASDEDGRLDPPVGPGGDEPEEPSINDPIEPPPVLPPPNVKNYVGSGWTWQGNLRQAFPQPVSIGTALVALGYQISFANNGNTPSTVPFNMISTHNMTIVREFQRDYNAAARAQTVDDPAVPSSLVPDGLVGTNTMRAIINARRWVQVLNVGWDSIVALS